MSVTFVASGNATLAASTTFATCSIGGVNYEAILLSDTAGSILGIAGNPLQVSGTFSACVASIVSASVTIVNNSTACVLYASACITNLAGSSAGSPLFASITNSPSVIINSGSITITNQVSASISNVASVIVSSGSMVVTAGSVIVNTSTGSPLLTRLTDGTDTVAVDAASRLLVTASLTDGLTVTSASVTIVNNSATCVLYTSACITNMAGSAAGSPLFASITNSPSVVVSSGSVVVTNALSASISNTVTVAQGASGASPWGMRILDAAGLAFGYGTASPIFTSTAISNSPSVVVSSGSVVVTNGLSASISNTVTVVQGASGASPWGVRVLDAAGLAYGVATGSPLFVSACLTNLAGSAAGSPLFTSVTNLAGSAAGSPLFVSACITNLSGSAAGSPLFASITNTVSASITTGSVAILTGANVIGSASAIQGTAAAITAPWPVKLSDGTDSAIVDAASRLGVTVTDGTNAFGLPASPFSVTGQGQTMYWAGSTLTIKQIDLSSSISGCTPIVASLAGFATVILNATFTTSSCQFIGWTACGNNGGASATIQTRMPFGTNGGMDAKRSPDGFLWAFPSGSTAVLTTTSACVVAGTINYIQVAS